jgi:redox-sensitive bicupin YhaK (pirin superfamily)
MFRGITIALKSKPFLEGAGVRIRRAFGYDDIPAFDPFLLLDEFKSDRPADYLQGFPWHPHRGIETVTYVLKGSVKHEDSIGNKDIILKDELQWMTAGSGVIHQELPDGDESYRLWAIQLWLNLPAKAKMTSPIYRSVTSDRIPHLQLSEGIRMRLVAGEWEGVKGPVMDSLVPVFYADLSMDSGKEIELPVSKDSAFFAYLLEGECCFHWSRRISQTAGTCLLFDRTGDRVYASAGSKGCRLLFCGGRPLLEPIAWRGSIVMNTQQELTEAYRDFENGTFIR